MARQLAEAQVARLLLALGVLVFAGLLPIAAIDYAAAALLVLVGLALGLVWPRGNRVLGFGVAALGLVLAYAAYKQPVSPGILNALTVLVAAILLGAAWLKFQGRW
jgi:hypothetical protein